MPGSRRALISIAGVVAVAGLSTGPSYAGGRGGGPVGENTGGTTIQLSSTTSTQHKSGGGNTGGTGTELPCWYDPVGDWKAYQELMARINQGTHDSGGVWDGYQQWYDNNMALLAAHEDDTPPGTFYQSTCADPNSFDASQWTHSNPDYVYVPANTPPNIPVVDAKFLAQYAVASAILPNPAPNLSPDAAGPSFVNLTTWAWQSGVQTKDLTAALPPQSATAVMTTPSMTLTTDGPTASGIPTVCQSANGIIGLKDTAGNTDPSAPGCGLKFTRPTAPGAHYTIHADVTWQVTWTSPQVAGVQTLPDIHMVTDTPVTASEIESIN